MPQIGENDAVAVPATNPDEPIQYFATSCLTVTCGFADGSRVGAHFSLVQGGTLNTSVATWNTFLGLINGRAATWAQVIGQIDMWNPYYLQVAPWFQTGSDTAVPAPLAATINAATGCAPTITHRNNEITILGDGTVL